VPGYENYATFHPTFLYESLWDLATAGVLLWADKRFRLGRGKVFALYIALYGFGRSFTETMRLDYSYDVFGPIRFNAAVAMLICLVGIVLLLWLRRYRPGREETVDPTSPVGPDAADASAIAEPEATVTEEQSDSAETPASSHASETRAGPEAP